MRQNALQALKHGGAFDLLIIGGGATGCGAALDAATRGLKTALIERADFSEGTSSRSTKLAHGGVRYLETAVKHLDRKQYALVKHALAERDLFLRNAPHLATRGALLTPLYSWINVPYVYAGLKLYDLLAGRTSIGRSTLIGRREALRRFPMLKPEGLKAAVLYCDGQFVDTRMAVGLALTARREGAAVANHLEAVAVLHDENGKTCGATVCDRLSGDRWDIGAKVVLNAAGPFADRLRRLDDPGARPILKGSSGVHIVLDKKFLPDAAGLLIPRTDDGRVLFILPWQGHALVGTTDTPSEIVADPRPSKEDVAYLLDHVRRYFAVNVDERDVKSAWSGIRPLVQDFEAGNTARLARDHVVVEAPSGLITIAGGKWTTYRLMAEEAIDRVVARGGFSHARPCRTRSTVLIGGGAYRPQDGVSLAKEFSLPPDVAAHLNRAYGDRAPQVAALAHKEGSARLHPNHPFIEAEVVYAFRCEDACRAADVLIRRLTLALTDAAAARASLSRVVALMAAGLGWDEQRKAKETALCEREFSLTF